MIQAVEEWGVLKGSWLDLNASADAIHGVPVEKIQYLKGRTGEVDKGIRGKEDKRSLIFKACQLNSFNASLLTPEKEAIF